MPHIKKRNKDRDNPYTIFEEEGKFFVTFKMNEDAHMVQVTKEVYDAFDKFELEDISHIHKYKKYIEHSSLLDTTLERRATKKVPLVEDIVTEKMEREKLLEELRRLSEVQKRRLYLYYVEKLTLKEIATLDGCSEPAVKKSIDAAIKNLQKKLQDEG